MGWVCPHNANNSIDYMEVINIGRASDNDFVINDAYASKHHCQLIHHDNGSYELIDISTYGTWVNGRKVNRKQILHHGDIVKLGNTCIPWMSYFGYQHTIKPPTSYPNYQSPPVYTSPNINIPSEINITKREEYSNVAKKGDDFQVPFFRNLGDKMGDTIGSTLGCLISLIIIVVVLAILGAIIS